MVPSGGTQRRSGRNVNRLAEGLGVELEDSWGIQPSASPSEGDGEDREGR